MKTSKPKKKETIPFKKIKTKARVYRVKGFLDKGTTGKGVRKFDKNFITLICEEVIDPRLKGQIKVPYEGHYEYPITFEHEIIE